MKYFSAKSRRHKRARDLVSVVLSFLLCIFLTALSCFVILKATALNPDFLMKQVKKSDYTAYIMQDMEDIFISYGMSSGFDEAFFKTVLHHDEVFQDVSREVVRVYAPDAPGADLDGFKKRVTQLLMDNARARDIPVTPAAESAIAYLAELCTETYKEGVELPLVSYASDLLAGANAPVRTAIIVLSVLCIFVLGFLFLLRSLKSFCRYTIYGLSGSALCLGVPAAAVLLSGRIHRLALTGKAIYHLAVTYLNQILTAVFLCVGLILIIVAALAFLYGILRRRAKKLYPPKGEYHLIDVCR